jgi:hypothetical protein
MLILKGKSVMGWLNLGGILRECGSANKRDKQ